MQDQLQFVEGRIRDQAGDEHHPDLRSALEHLLSAGGKRNEPAFVAYIADKIAEIHMTTREQVAKITTSSAARLFGWGG